jgi:hypothetical protein
MHPPACREKALPYFVGLNTQNPTFHQSFVKLEAPHANQAIEPIWQQKDDSAVFEPLLDSCVNRPTIKWKEQLLH